MKSLFSDKQVEQLVAFVEQRSGKSGLLRYAGQLYSKHVVLANQGFPQPYTGFQGAHKPIVEAQRREAQAAERPARGGAEPRPDRPRLLALRRPAAGDRGEPAAAARSVFLDRCVGCHGLSRRRQGARREVPLAAAGRLHRQGRRVLRRRHRPGRLLLPHPARLARDGDGELRRPALGQRHLARRPLHQDDPERDAASRTASPSRGTTSSGSRRKELLAWIEDATRSSTENVELRQEAGHRSVHAARRCGSSRASRRATAS